MLSLPVALPAYGCDENAGLGFAGDLDAAISAPPPAEGCDKWIGVRQEVNLY